MIRYAARDLAMMAPELVKQQPYYALAALSLGLAQVAVICRVSYSDLVMILSQHYEHVLLDQVEEELKASGSTDVMVKKPTGEQ
jgi:hypothetical protein